MYLYRRICVCIIDFYYHIDEKYKIVPMPYPLKRRGRPSTKSLNIK